LVPGTLTRFRWPDPYDDDVRRIREEVQEEGRGLYVLVSPWNDRVKVLVEAYYPVDIRERYFPWLEPAQKVDARMGRLVVLFNDLTGDDEPLCWRGDLDPRVIVNFRRGNRNARAKFKRNTCASYLAQALADMHEQEEDAAFAPYGELYEDAFNETRKYLQPKVSFYTGEQDR
jgi:hypothetical protein